MAKGSSGDEQINRVNPSSLTAVNQVSLNLARDGASPVMQLHLYIGIGELAQVNCMLVLGRTAADLHLGRRAYPHQATFKMITPRCGQQRAAVDTPVGARVDQVLAGTHRSAALSAASRSAI